MKPAVALNIFRIGSSVRRCHWRFNYKCAPFLCLDSPSYQSYQSSVKQQAFSILVAPGGQNFTPSQAPSWDRDVGRRTNPPFSFSLGWFWASPESLCSRRPWLGVQLVLGLVIASLCIILYCVSRIKNGSDVRLCLTYHGLRCNKGEESELSTRYNSFFKHCHLCNITFTLYTVILYCI